MSGGAAETTSNVYLDSLDAFTNLTSDGASLDATPVAGGSLHGAAAASFYPDSDLLGQTRQGSREVGAVDVD